MGSQRVGHDWTTLGASLRAQPWFNSWVRKILWRRDRLPTPVFLGFPGGSAGKESACNAGDLGLISGLGRSPGEGKGYPLQYSGPENSMDCIIHGVAKSWIWLSSFHFHHIKKRESSKWIKDWRVRPEVMKLLEEKVGRALFDINHSNTFLDLSLGQRKCKHSWKVSMFLCLGIKLW